MLSLPGCEKPEEIRVYSVAKPPPMERKASGGTAEETDEIAPNRDLAQNRTGAASPAVRTEMLGAIMPRGKMTWFFKLTGPVSAVSEVKKQFAVFIKSVKFGEEKPEWELPEGWKEEPGSQMRFATIRVAASAGPLEMSVIPLPTGEGDFEPQLLANANRWREQLGLGRLTEKELPASKEIIKIELNGAPVWFTDFVGESRGNSMGGPFAGNAGPGRGAAGEPGAGKLPFEFQLPEGWTAGKANSMQLAAFDVRDGDRRVSVTVSTAGGDQTANINRWRDQVALKPLTAAEIEQQARKISVDGHDGILVEAIGPESALPRETIQGVIVEVQGRQWFIKLKGDSELATREKDRFEQFVKSVKFR